MDGLEPPDDGRAAVLIDDVGLGIDNVHFSGYDKDSSMCARCGMLTQYYIQGADGSGETIDGTSVRETCCITVLGGTYIRTFD